MDTKNPRWIHGQPSNANEMNEMNLMVQREMSNLKALKRLSLNTSVLPAQDPDLPALEISELPEQGENNVTQSLSPQRSPDPSGRRSEEVGGGIQRQPSFTRQPSLHRQSSLSKTPTFTRQPSIQRQKVTQSAIQRQGSSSSQKGEDPSILRQHSGQSIDRTGSIHRQHSSPALHRRASTGPGVLVNTGSQSHAASAYTQSPRFARHHSIVSASNSIHREHSAPVRSQTSTDDDPVDLSDNDKNDSDIRNMWVPAGLHPELAPNEWQAFVETKLNEIRKSQEAQQQSRTNKNHSRLSHIVSDPEEYVDASAVLYQRRASSNEDKRKSILELSRDFVNENSIDDENDGYNDANPHAGAFSVSRRPSHSATPGLKLGATSLRRSTHRLHKPTPERSSSVDSATSQSSMRGREKTSSGPNEDMTNSLGSPKGLGLTDTGERRSFSHSLRRAGRRPQIDPPSSSTPQDYVPFSSSASASTASPFSPSTTSATTSPATSKISPVASTNHDRQVTTAMAPSPSATASKCTMRTRPPLSVSVSAAKAVAHTAEQPPSPSAATPSPTASVMLGYRRRRPPKSPPALDSNSEAFQSSLITPTTPSDNIAQAQSHNHEKRQGLLPGPHGATREKSLNSSMLTPPVKDSSFEKDKKLPPIPGESKPVEEEYIKHNADTSTLNKDPADESTDESATNSRDQQKEDAPVQSMRDPLDVEKVSPPTSGFPSTSSSVLPADPAKDSKEALTDSSAIDKREDRKEDKKEDKKERRWKWLDKQSQSHSEPASDTSPHMKSFTNLFKKKDKNKDSKEKAPTPSPEKGGSRLSSGLTSSSTAPKSSSPVEPSGSPPNQAAAADLISGSSVHKGANSHQPGVGAPEPPPHLSRRTKKGHARVQSRVSNDAENYDMNSVDQRSSAQLSPTAAAAAYNQTNMSPKNGGVSGTADEDNMIDLNAGAAEPDADVMASNKMSRGIPRDRNSRQNQRGSRRGGNSEAKPQDSVNAAESSEKTAGSTGAAIAQGKNSQQTSPVDIKLPYDIPAHQVSDRSFVMMYHRFPLHIERAIYRLSHMKLMNPRRPLHQQVLLSNFMYAYLNLINYGYQQQQLAAMEEQQQQQQQEYNQDPHASSPGASTRLEESQLEQLRRIEENNYGEGMYAQSSGAEEDSSSSSDEEERGSESPNKRAHTSGSDSIY